MAQNFKRRITLLPNSLNQIQNSIKKFKDIDDITEKADNDTFNKSIIYEKTPIKEKKLNPSLLETPVMEKNLKRKISINSPLSFSEKFSMDEMQTQSGEVFFNKNIEKTIDNSTRKKISNFSHQSFQESDDEDNFGEDYEPDFNLYFNFGKRKKGININHNKINNVIIFNDNNYNKYIFALFNDNDLFEKGFNVNNNYKDNKEIKLEKFLLNIHDDENSDEEQIQQGYNICFKQLDEAINYYSNNPNYISRNINIKNEH